jgi:hypothetical protein
MFRITIILTLALLYSPPNRAQEMTAASNSSTETRDAASIPDAPTPHVEPKGDEATPCPAGAGKPCALLGGRAYFPDLLKSTQHDRTWFDAMKHPAMLTVSGLLIATTVLDIEGTDRCLRAHACREVNPIMSKTIDRPRQYATAMGLNALAIYGLGRAKQKGRGNFGVMLFSALSAAHLYFGLDGLSADAAPAATTVKRSVRHH